MNKFNILLAYVSFPIATALYFERALRKNHNVITCGPNIPAELIKKWDLENLKTPVKNLDIPFPSFTPDMKEIANYPNYSSPDLFLWVESVPPGYFPLNIDQLKCPTAGYFIDSHINLNWHVQWAPCFDHVFIAQKEYIPQFKQAGCKNVYWLPLGCDPEIHSKKSQVKEYDVGFVGSLVDPRRIELVNKIKSKFNFHYERVFLDDMANVLSKSKVVFNNAIRNDLNMRVFEALSIGSFLLTDATAGNGQEEMFVDGEDLVIYNDNDIFEKIEYYLSNEEERENIADRGHEIILNAHTYEHRTDEIIKVCLEGQNRTPSPEEWRERSLP